MEAFAGTHTWRERVEKLLTSVREQVERWHRHVGPASDVSDACHGVVRVISEQLTLVSNELNKATDTESEIDWQHVVSLVDQLLQDVEGVEKIFLKELCDVHGEHADTPGFRQFQAEYNCKFPAVKLDTARDLLKCLNVVADWLNSAASKLPRSQFMLLRGAAGVGKTHAIVDHALHRREQDQLCLVFFGEDFDGAEPWQIIAHKLGFAGNMSRDELWGMINTASEGTGQRAVIYIDALNESHERQKCQQSWLPTLRQQLSQYLWLKLCISCRDTYLDEVIDDETQWPWFEHNGFVGREFDAIRQFFEFYQLQPPATPLMQREFANPLFLHLVCQGLTGAGLSSIPLGSRGFTEVLKRTPASRQKRAGMKINCYTDELKYTAAGVR